APRECAVDRRADRAAIGAEIGPPVAAPLALAARRVVGLGHDAGAEPALVDALAELRDHAAELVPHRDGREGPELVVEDVEVGSADAGARDRDHDLAGAGPRLRPLDEPDVSDAGRQLREPPHAGPLSRRRV